MAGRRGRFFFDFEEDEDDEFEDAVFLNPFSTTYYLGRGRFGDNSRLHRGIMLIREREFEGLSAFRGGSGRGRSGPRTGLGRSGRHHRIRRRGRGRSPEREREMR